MKHLMIAAIAALALLPTSSFAAGSLKASPASLELSLSKRAIAALTITFSGPDELVIHPLGCPHSRVASIRHVGTLYGNARFSVEARTAGSCTFHFSLGTETVAVPVTVAP